VINIYTDGSALAHNNHPDFEKGGFACVFVVGDEVRKVISKGVYPAKTGMCELLGVLTALKVLSKDQSAVICSDSMYVLNGFLKGWLKSWEKQGWPARIKNQEIQKALLNEYRKFPIGAIKFKHVKGHQGNLGNEIADLEASYKKHDIFKSFEYYL
jgi:ribonuclease HI